MLYTMVFDGSKYLLMLWDKAQISSIVNDNDIDHLIDINGAPIRHKEVFKDPLHVSFNPLFKSDQGLQVPDICVFEGRLYLNSKAYEVLGDLIRDDGEFLPTVDDKGEAGYIFTPLRVAESIDALDTGLSRKNEWGDLENLAFHENLVKDWSVFRTEFDCYMSLQCQENIKEAIEKSGLTGVFFTTDLGNTFLKTEDSSSFN